MLWSLHLEFRDESAKNCMVDVYFSFKSVDQSRNNSWEKNNLSPLEETVFPLLRKLVRQVLKRNTVKKYGYKSTQFSFRASPSYSLLKQIHV